MTKYPISAFMTPTPLTIESKVLLREAKWILRNKQIRHLPVTDGGKLVGVLSARDINTAHVYLGDDSESQSVSVAMTPHPYCVKGDAELADVAAEMGEQKYGCALILDPHGKVIGIFTMVDAVKVLAQALRGETGSWPGAKAADPLLKHLSVEP